MEGNPVLAGKTAVVTGAALGIGAWLAQTLESAGAGVIRHVQPGQEDLVSGLAMTCDFRSPDAVRELVSDIGHAAPDGVDVLVNNAGLEVVASMDAITMEAARMQFEVNFFAPLALMTGLAPLLRAPGASVVNVTSIHAQVPAAGNGVYCATKAALDMLSRTAAVELGPRGIRVNSLAPGAIETDMNRNRIQEVGRDYFDRAIPLGYVASPSALADALLFLASDRSAYVTGTSLVVDGGYSQHLVRYPAN